MSLIIQETLENKPYLILNISSDPLIRYAPTPFVQSGPDPRWWDQSERVFVWCAGDRASPLGRAVARERGGPSDGRSIGSRGTPGRPRAGSDRFGQRRRSLADEEPPGHFAAHGDLRRERFFRPGYCRAIGIRWHKTDRDQVALGPSALTSLGQGSRGVRYLVTG